MQKSTTRRLLVLLLGLGLLAGSGCSVTTASIEDEPDPDAAQAESGVSTKPAPGQAPSEPVAAPPPPPRVEGAKGGTMRFGLEREPLTLDPAHAVDHESVLICENLFDTLVAYGEGTSELVGSERDGGTPVPAERRGLASSWYSTQDELTWIFELRSGVTFHDGTPVTAEAVAFSFERQLDAEHPFKGRGDPVFWRRLLPVVRQVRVLDGSRIAIELTRPYAPLLACLAMPQTGIVSPDAVKRLGADFEKRPVGSGPFRLSGWSAGRSIVLSTNTDYWGEKPRLDSVELRFVGDASARLLLVANGQLDAMEGIDIEDIPLARSRGLAVTSMTGANVVYLGFNTWVPPELVEEDMTREEGLEKLRTILEMGPSELLTRQGLASARLRKAIARAVDAKAITENVYGELARPAKGVVPESIWGSDKSTAPPAFDPELGHYLAKQLLRQAGYQEGFQLEICTLDGARSYLPRPHALARAVREQLEPTGLDVRLRVVGFERFQEIVQSRRHQAFLMGWPADIGDPDNLLFPLLDRDGIREGDSTNLTFYDDEELHRLLVEAQAVGDRATRELLYAKVHERIREQVPLIPICHIVETVVNSPAVGGLRPHPVGFRRFIRVSRSG